MVMISVCLLHFGFHLRISFSVNTWLIPCPWLVLFLRDFWCTWNTLNIVTAMHFHGDSVHVSPLDCTLHEDIAITFPFGSLRVGRVPYSQKIWNSSEMYNGGGNVKHKKYLLPIWFTIFFIDILNTTVSKTTRTIIPSHIVLVTGRRQKNVCAMGSSRYCILTGKGNR